VDDEDEKWHHFITLLEITRTVFSTEIKRSHLPYLSSLIESYHTGYIKFYGHLKPKDHFLGHYPYLWEQYGSLLDFTCFRSEANHQLLKRFVSGMGNYTNIAKSISAW